MPILTLTAARTAPADSFPPGCYAYAYTDRPVRYQGELITPDVILATASDDRTLSFDLIAATDADNATEFAYVITVFDPIARIIWSHSIVMPNEDAFIYDLVPEPIDLDSPICTTTPEIITYCGVNPSPHPIIPGNVAPGGAIQMEVDSLMQPPYLPPYATYSANFPIVPDETYDLLLPIPPAQSQTYLLELDTLFHVYFDNTNMIHDDVRALHYDEINGTDYNGTTFEHVLFSDDPRLENLTSIRINTVSAPGEPRVVTVIGLNMYVAPSPTDQEINAYNLAKAAYDDCIAQGGVDGLDPQL